MIIYMLSSLNTKYNYHLCTDKSQRTGLHLVMAVNLKTHYNYAIINAMVIISFEAAKTSPIG